MSLGLPPLSIPGPVEQIVVQGNDPPIVEHDLSVLPRDGLAPPFVVDAPALAHDGHTPGGLARHAYVNRLSVFVRTHGHDSGLAEWFEARAMAHGSKLRRA